MLECRFAEFLYLCLPLSLKAQILPQIKGGGLGGGGEFCVWLGVMILHRQRDVIWIAYGVAR